MTLPTGFTDAAAQYIYTAALLKAALDEIAVLREKNERLENETVTLYGRIAELKKKTEGENPK